MSSLSKNLFYILVFMIVTLLSTTITFFIIINDINRNYFSIGKEKKTQIYEHAKDSTTLDTIVPLYRYNQTQKRKESKVHKKSSASTSHYKALDTIVSFPIDTMIKGNIEPLKNKKASKYLFLTHPKLVLWLMFFPFILVFHLAS